MMYTLFAIATIALCLITFIMGIRVAAMSAEELENSLGFVVTFAIVAIIAVIGIVGVTLFPILGI